MIKKAIQLHIIIDGKEHSIRIEKYYIFIRIYTNGKEFWGSYYELADVDN